jgi:hypothetical protein
VWVGPASKKEEHIHACENAKSGTCMIWGSKCSDCKKLFFWDITLGIPAKVFRNPSQFAPSIKALYPGRQNPTKLCTLYKLCTSFWYKYSIFFFQFVSYLQFHFINALQHWNKWIWILIYLKFYFKRRWSSVQCTTFCECFLHNVATIMI